MRTWLLVVIFSVAGCALTPGAADGDRAIVLRYIGPSAEVFGPFSKTDKQEINALTEKDRAEAATMLDHGAVGYHVLLQGPSAAPRREARVLLILQGKVVRDFTVP